MTYNFSTLLFSVKFYIESNFYVENKCLIMQKLKWKAFVNFAKRSLLVQQADSSMQRV